MKPIFEYNYKYVRSVWNPNKVFIKCLEMMDPTEVEESIKHQ